jgi:hypothetical protein
VVKSEVCTVAGGQNPNWLTLVAHHMKSLDQVRKIGCAATSSTQDGSFSNQAGIVCKGEEPTQQHCFCSKKPRANCTLQMHPDRTKKGIELTIALGAQVFEHSFGVASQ